MKTLLSFLVLLFFCPVLIFSQPFEKNVLIDLPGDNYDFDLLSTDGSFPASQTFITWVNKNDSVYTVYLKSLSSVSGPNIIISSDSRLKSKPQITYDKVVWQNYTGEFFQIIERSYWNDSLGEANIIQDSLTEDPQFSLSNSRIAWIMNDNLYIKEIYPVLGEPILIDSFDCMSPDLFKDDESSYCFVVYERIINGEHNIYLAEYKDYPYPGWDYTMLSDGDNRNPEFGVCDITISFESIKNGISRIKYGYYYIELFMETENVSCNYRNPDVFSYPIPTNHFDNTPLFIAFDTDSIENNNEVFIKTFFSGIDDTLMNVSDMEGDDLKPKTGFLCTNDSFYVIIVWLHNENSKTDIWIATDEFNPIGSVKNNNSNSITFDLLQNYPNPFNPSTTIEYNISKPEYVNLKVYNVLGQQVAELVNEIINSGTHKVVFNASGLSSGVYICELKLENGVKARKMILAK